MRFLLPLLLLLSSLTSLSYADSRMDRDPCRRLSNPKEVVQCRQVLHHDGHEALQERPPAESFQGYLLKSAKVMGAIGAGVAGLFLLGASVLLVTGAPVNGC